MKENIKSIGIIIICVLLIISAFSIKCNEPFKSIFTILILIIASKIIKVEGD